jgi:FAD/FMN-containing dehydrogenase
VTSATEAPGQQPERAPGAERLEVRNWGEDLVWHPRAVADPHSVEDVQAIMRDSEKYPSPVRALGSRHSTTPAAEAEGGTNVRMRGMERILEFGEDTVRAQGGALYIDVAKELQKRNLQFYVNIELGNLTIGSAACCATKDASMPGEYGQVSSYCISMKLVTADGSVLEISEESDPELMQAARSGYGMLGIVVEATFRVRPLQAMEVEHKLFTIDEFVEALPELARQNQSIMLYLFPHLDKVATELRRYKGAEAGATTRATHWLWKLRNKLWSSGAPGFGYLMERHVRSPRVRYAVLDRFNRILGLTTRSVMSAANTIPTDQMIRYPSQSDWKRYTFSIWAFPEEHYTDTLREYFAWAKQYYREQGWRVNMLHVGYRIEQDQQALFSYTWNGRVLTIDPVSTGAPGWRDYLSAYNDFCSEHGGSPLLNQTWGLKPHHVRRAYGDRIERFEQVRKRMDPDDRLLNGYFRELLQAPAES